MKGFRRDLAIQVAASLITLALVAVGGWILSNALDAHPPLLLSGLTVISVAVAVGAVTGWIRSRKESQGLRKWKGLQKATGLIEYWEQLDSSEEHPRSKLAEIHGSLDFMGHGASKWTEQSDEMADMLKRVSDAKKNVRMLLLDPGSDICSQMSKNRCEDADALPRKIVHSLLRLRKLKQNYPILHVRLYEHKPHLRLTFVEGRTVIVGHYQEYKYDSKDSPLMVWERGVKFPWSFYTPFIGYFDEEWNAVEPISWSYVDELAKKYDVTL